MPAPTPERLRRIRDFPALLAFLSEDLHWPLPEDAAPEDATFDWDADELRLAAPAADRLRGGLIRQLRPLHAAQPWGVFFVEFNEARLHRTALRQILRRLVPNRRRDASLQAWRHDNLLFICATRDYRRISFAHFRGGGDPARGQARLATFGWDADDERGLRTLREFNLPPLAYPAQPADAPAWLARWAGAFDVEPVTREFFRVYKEIFERVEAAVTGLATPSASPSAPPSAFCLLPSAFDRRRLWTQRLFNRLLFIAFIEKKGWLTLGGRSDYLAALWEDWTRRPDPAGGNFYNSRLRLLFFQALNNAGARDLAGINGGGFLARVIGDVPYLNGGLFEQDADDADPAVAVPDAALGRVFTDLFDRFNFTVTESTPLDVEVAVDPEMLGKVFEELVTGRHESGSYYTPKPVVAFMCREALKHYLAGALPDAPAALAAFVDSHDAAGLADGEAALRALRRVRVCDPACGSGAYLLGMLHELLDLRACLFATGAPDAASVHARKLGIIQANLYGVDLDPFAVNIARLRLWLSLAVDAAEPLPLPNLDFKIEAGDSLAAPDPQGAFAAGQGSLRDEAVRRFREAKSAYLSAQGDAKRVLRETIADARGDLAVWLASQAPAGAFDWAVEFAEIFAPGPPGAALDGGLNLGDTLAGPPEPGGFDIVVGNPPYVRIQVLKQENPALAARLRRIYRSAGKGNYDLYVVFVERSLQLLGPGGQLAFILPHKFFNVQYGEPLRELISNGRHLRHVVHFGDEQVFSTASNYVCMLFLAKSGANECRWVRVDNLSEWINTFNAPEAFLPSSRITASEWNFAGSASDALLDKLRRSGTRLLDLPADMSRGHSTGDDDVFVLDADADLVEEEILRVPVFASDFRRYCFTPNARWRVIFPYRREATGITLLSEGELQADFPRAYRYLTERREQLARRKGARVWYGFTAPRNLNLHDQAQILVPLLAEKGSFAIVPPDLHGTLCPMASGGFTIAAITSRYRIEYLLALLNSRLLFWMMLRTSNLFRGGWITCTKQYFGELPIREIHDSSPSERAEYESLVHLAEQVLNAKRTTAAANTQALEAEIDERVFRLYGLTADEQALVLAATAAGQSS